MDEPLKLAAKENNANLVLNEIVVILPFPAFQAASAAPRGQLYDADHWSNQALVVSSHKKSNLGESVASNEKQSQELYCNFCRLKKKQVWYLFRWTG